jgi:hypothetical protein
MKRSFSFKGLVWGIIFTGVYLLLAGAAAGGGHGALLFLAPLFPYGLGLLLFPVIGFLAGNLDSFFTKSLFLIMLAVHYGLVLTVIKFMWVENVPYFEKVWNSSPTLIILPLTFYVLGNLVAYAAFIHSLKHREK